MSPIEAVRAAGQTCGLKPYQIDFCIQAEQIAGFRDKNVLEIGGSLARDFVLGALGARSWIAIEDMSYWPSDAGISVDYSSFEAAAGDLSPYRVINGKIEQLPESYFGRFDLIFSIAAFQHIHMLPTALDVMFQALRPGGRLIAWVGPIWSAFNGPLLRAVTDKMGRTFSMGNNPVPPWGHLLLRPSELYLELCKKTDRETAAQIVYEIYTSPRVNRFFLEDYADFTRMSAFGRGDGSGRFIPAAALAVPPDIQSRLETLYPGRTQFGPQNILLDLVRVR